MSVKYLKEFQIIKTNFTYKIFIILFLIIGVEYSAFSQEGLKGMKSYKIVGISVEGNKTADQIAIIANSGLKVNEEISIPSEQTRNAIARIWALRIFSDVQIEIEKLVGTDAYLLIKVSEHPRLGKVIFNGNDEVGESDFNKKIIALKGQIISPQEINKISKQIKNVYEEAGFLQANITSSLIKSTDTTTKDYLDLKFEIVEGAEVKIEKIEFFGNNDIDEGDLKGAMADTHEKIWWKFWQSSKFEKKKYIDDKKKVVQFLKKKGYRDAEIISDSTNYDASKKKFNFNNLSLYRSTISNSKYNLGREYSFSNITS